MSLNLTLEQLGLSQREVALQTGLSQSTVSRINAGQWPDRNPQQARQRLVQCLRHHGASAEQLLALFANTTQKLALQVSTTCNAVPEVSLTSTHAPDGATLTKEDVMLLQNESLTPEARKHLLCRAIRLWTMCKAQTMCTKPPACAMCVRH